jgi:hypothetical protein
LLLHEIVAAVLKDDSFFCMVEKPGDGVGWSVRAALLAVAIALLDQTGPIEQLLDRGLPALGFSPDLPPGVWSVASQKKFAEAMGFARFIIASWIILILLSAVPPI